MKNSIAAIILAAGQGKRMRSSLPKVLHPCCGAPLIAHVVRLALARHCSPVVVVISPDGRRVQELLTAMFPDAPLRFAVQEVARGTADATRVGFEAISKFKGDVLILAGDVPLLRTQTIGRLQKAARTAKMALLTSEVPDPTGYGRICRDGRRVTRIVEHKDASSEERSIREINVGVYLCPATLLRKGLSAIGSENAQGEFYLTDLVEIAATKGQVGAVRVKDFNEVSGVNTRAQLATVEAALRRRLIAHFQDKGVSFTDPDNTFLGIDVRIGRDAVIGVGVQLWGTTRIGEGVVVDGPTVIKNSVIGSDSHVYAFSHLEAAAVGRGARVGPYARLRPGTKLSDEVRVGNFVEVKKSHFGRGAKANHLAYIGDAKVGAGSNVGAGTITCNYDGTNKHPTVLGDGVFVGSNSTLVAPLKVGRGAYIAAGSTVTREVPSDALAFGRARQTNRDEYAANLRARNKAQKGSRGDKEKR